MDSLGRKGPLLTELTIYKFTYCDLYWWKHDCYVNAIQDDITVTPVEFSALPNSITMEIAVLKGRGASNSINNLNKNISFLEWCLIFVLNFFKNMKIWSNNNLIMQKVYL